VELDVVFVGTSGSVPTARRGAPSVLVRRGGDRFLVDCGEGTQRQLLRSTVGLVDVPDVLLTHYHADHFLGLPGLLKTLALRGRDVPLSVAGPAGLKGMFQALRRVIGRLPYELVLQELEPGDVITRGDYRVEVFAVDHGVEAVGYAFVEDARPGRFDVETARSLGVLEGPAWGQLQRGKAVELDDGRTVEPREVLGAERQGRRVVITGDTRPTRTVVEAANEAQLLIHDSTFGHEEAERALETRHSTAREAAEIARFAGVQLLALVHLSSRYGGAEITSEAREAFEQSVAPRDFDVIEVPFPERGTPVLRPRGARAARRGSGGKAREDGPAEASDTPTEG
jgi:ribonuclease Z